MWRIPTSGRAILSLTTSDGTRGAGFTASLPHTCPDLFQSLYQFRILRLQRIHVVVVLLIQGLLFFLVFCVEFFLESPGVYLATKEPTHGPAQDHFGQTATATANEKRVCECVRMCVYVDKSSINQSINHTESTFLLRTRVDMYAGQRHDTFCYWVSLTIPPLSSTHPPAPTAFCCCLAA
jgi:hypothetical protein